MRSIITPTFRVEYTDNNSRFPYANSMCWDNKRDGRPTDGNLAKWRKAYNDSFEPNGVNAHCTTKDGGIYRISNCRIVRQSNRQVVAKFIAPMFEIA